MYLSDKYTKKIDSENDLSENQEIVNVINKLRFLMIGCRKDARISIDEACKLIQIDKKTSAIYFAHNILRTLEEVIGKNLFLGTLEKKILVLMNNGLPA